MSTLRGRRPAAYPVWFGDQERRLFGWVHPPPAAARGGVLLCPPVGKEYQSSYYSLRLLAEDLAGRGFLVLRFDYDGTGDSDGASTDGGRVPAWTGSVASAVELLRQTGVTHVGVVGLRIGALLARSVGAGVDSLVLWDPVPSGRAFLREQRALSAMTMTSSPPDDGSLEAPWAVYSAETVADLTALAPASTAPTDILVLERDDRRLSDRARAGLAVDGAQWDVVTGHQALMDESLVPRAAVRRVADWLDERLPRTGTVAVLPRAAEPTTVHDDSGRPVTEQTVQAGTAGLMGILTSTDRSAGPVVILIGGHVDHHIGPARLWVDLARRWAADGARVLRLDLSGIGDSGVRPGQEPQKPYAAEGADDLCQIAGAISPDDPSDVVLVGFCSGAYAVIEAGVRLRPRSVVTVNYIQEFTPPEVANGGEPDPGRAAWLARPGWMIALRDRGLLRKARELMPEWGWRVLDKLGIIPSPATAFTVLVSHGVHTRAIACRSDGRILLDRARRQLARLTRSGLFTFSVVDEVGHAMLSRAERGALLEVLAPEIWQATGIRPAAGPAVDVRGARSHVQAPAPRAETMIRSVPTPARSDER
ncbi:MAG: alpha/beta hydrolase [Frankiales bacterium]|nr:alpha/beta hydrolase [Frankiales bacterium]